MATEAQVLEALRAIVDPDLNRDIVSLGFVKNLKIEGGAVRFDIELTTPACPVKDAFKRQAEAAAGALPGVDRVEVTMTAQHRSKAQPDLDLGQIGAIVAVSSCKGGVG